MPEGERFGAKHAVQKKSVPVNGAWLLMYWLKLYEQGACNYTKDNAVCDDGDVCTIDRCVAVCCLAPSARHIPGAELLFVWRVSSDG
jgi:hypothetical protein